MFEKIDPFGYKTEFRIQNIENFRRLLFISWFIYINYDLHIDCVSNV